MKRYADTNRFMADVAASAWVVQAFALYVLILAVLAGAGDGQWRDADPILKIFPRAVTLWGIIVLSAAILLTWRGLQRLAPRAVLASYRHVLGGAAAAVAVSLVVRLVFGPNLPDFIPPEESATPGFLLGMSAGLAEELIFRLILTPLLFAVLRKRLGLHWSAALTIATVAVSFALLHEVGAADFSVQHFLARVIGPGVVMGLAVFVVSPQFLVTAHCGAHIMIPLLFA